MKEHYDIIVIGGGPVGLATAYNAAKSGKSVLVLERFNLFNQSGSSNDLVRMYRTTYTTDYMAKLAYQSMQVWDDLEKDAGESLRWMTGLLNFGNPSYESGPEGNLFGPIENLKKFNLPYKELTSKQIMENYPFQKLPENYEGLYTPNNGCINVPTLLRTLYRLSCAHGCDVKSHAQVTDMQVSEHEVFVFYHSKEKIHEVSAQKVVITAGAYANDILSPIDVNLKLDIWEMVYEYYSTDPGPKGTLFPSMWFQFENPTDGDPAKSNLFYGFPSVPWGPPNLARIAVDNAVRVIKNPVERQIGPSPNDLRITAEWVGKHCIGVDTTPNYSGSCLQTNVCDNMYVLDFLPESVGLGHKNVAIFTAGWGMKMVPLLGKILSELVIDGRTAYDISKFKITRRGILE